MLQDHTEINRKSWNEATLAHNSHKPNQAEFFLDGGSTLFPEEVGLLGDVKNKNICHLLCNSGQDTLSIAKLGANIVGVDISDNAIEFATTLSKDSKIEATFVRSEACSYLESTEPNQFDVVFISYGAINWLPDINRLAQGIHKILKPGGRLIIVEFHPILFIFDESTERVFPYTTSGTVLENDVGVSDYVARSEGCLNHGGEFAEGIVNFENKYPCSEFAWGIGDILSSILSSGLVLNDFKEYLHCNGFKPFDEMKASDDRTWTIEPNIPMMFSLVATKPAT
ncbi:methyltransferase type 12, partial [Basidiobolus meristosporus CBS 931.73]